MRFLRRISNRQLLAVGGAVVALAAGTTALAMATNGSGPKPNPKPLPVAVHDALTAPSVSGVSARIKFTNHLVDSSSIQAGSDPIISGATGRLWASADGMLRLELQASSNGGGGGDSQVLVDHNHFWIYESGANTVYQGTIPGQGQGSSASQRESGKAAEQPPSLDQIKRDIARLEQHATLSGATPSDVAGRPTYTVRIAPKNDGGLLGGAELAWDSARGVPLRAAVYASGDSSPVLQLEATDVSFGSVSSSVFAVSPPPGAKVVDLSPPGQKSANKHDVAPVTGVSAVQKQIDFRLVAPDSLAGLPRGEVRGITVGKHAAALVTYGKGLGGVAVIESGSEPGTSPAPAANGEVSLPKVSINGTQGEELDTALGTLLRFSRGGVDYTVVGSVPAAAAEAAARGL